MEDEVRVRVRNIPRIFDIKSHIVPTMKWTSSSSENKQQYLPAEDNRYLLLSFYDTYIFLVLYI